MAVPSAPQRAALRMPEPTGPVTVRDLVPRRRRVPLRAPATLLSASVLLALLVIADVAAIVAWLRGAVVVATLQVEPLTWLAGFRSGVLLFAVFPVIALGRGSLLARSWVLVIAFITLVLIAAELGALGWMFNLTVDNLSTAEQTLLLLDAVGIVVVVSLLLSPEAGRAFDVSERLRDVEYMRETGQLRDLEYGAAQAAVLNHVPLGNVRFRLAPDGRAHTVGGHFALVGDEWMPAELLSGAPGSLSGHP